MNCFISIQSVRISEIEVRDKQQEKEISILKSASKDDKKEIELFLGERHIKRPARLLPVALLYGKKNNTVDEVDHKQFFGPPTNCSDLAKLGYTLNGYYMTRNRYNEGSIQVVYCKFRQPNLNLEKQKFGLETFIGNLQLKRKNSPVHFQVERCYEVKGSSTIRFKKERLNIGLAMNVTTGVFTAPFDGIYYFKFTGLKHNYPDKNAMYLPLSLSTSMALKANDRLHLTAQVPGKLYEGDYTYDYFTGWLVADESHY